MAMTFVEADMSIKNARSVLERALARQAAVFMDSLDVVFYLSKHLVEERPWDDQSADVPTGTNID